MAGKVLIVEDDPDLSGVMKVYLENEGYEVIQVYNGMEAAARVKEEQPLLVILDLMLPGKEGTVVCREIRRDSHCPVIVISARSSDGDKLLSLGMGADDYMTKPFSLPELVGRVKSHIRRFTTFSNVSKKEEKQEERRFGRLTVIPGAFLVKADGEEIPFTAREFQLIEFMSAHPSQVFTKEQLMECVWGMQEYLDENTVAVYVGRIREKLAKKKLNVIKTVWGAGYKWEI